MAGLSNCRVGSASRGTLEDVLQDRTRSRPMRRSQKLAGHRRRNARGPSSPARGNPCGSPGTEPDLAESGSDHRGLHARSLDGRSRRRGSAMAAPRPHAQGSNTITGGEDMLGRRRCMGRNRWRLAERGRREHPRRRRRGSRSVSRPAREGQCVGSHVTGRPLAPVAGGCLERLGRSAAGHVTGVSLASLGGRSLGRNGPDGRDGPGRRSAAPDAGGWRGVPPRCERGPHHGRLARSARRTVSWTEWTSWTRWTRKAKRGT
jgi:hypothetical protein